MKKVIISTILCLSLCAGKGQDFFFGNSVHFDHLSYFIESNNGKIKKSNQLTGSPFQFTFRTLFKNNFEVTLGFNFYTASQHYDIYPANEQYYTPLSLTVGNYSAYSIPISVGYNLKIYKGLAVRFNSGFDFDFYVPQQGFGNLLESGLREISNSYLQYISNWSKQWSYEHTFNVLINNSVSLYYVTNFNLHFGIFVAYHAGLRQIWNNQAFVTDESIIENSFPLPVFSEIRSNSNGSYFNYGIEIGYRLRGKQSEKVVH